MSEMVERVKNAIYTACMDSEIAGNPDEHCTEDMARAAAVAAIAAMREPTEEMLSDGSKAADERWYPEDPPDIAEGWRAMIDAALK